jgi:hypothetical protein
LGLKLVAFSTSAWAENGIWGFDGRYARLPSGEKRSAGTRLFRASIELNPETCMSKTDDNNQDILVPYAKDGTCFSPALRRPKAGSFMVGKKGAEVTFASFDEALDFLNDMPKAMWRRPNSEGNWGLVAAVRLDVLS